MQDMGLHVLFARHPKLGMALPAPVPLLLRAHILEPNTQAEWIR